MTVYQWLCLLGIPALIAGVFKYLHTLIKRNADDNKALKLGIQALLRSQMISDLTSTLKKGSPRFTQGKVLKIVGSNIIRWG